MFALKPKMGCCSSKVKTIVPYRELLPTLYPKRQSFRILDIYDGDTLTVAVEIGKMICSVRLRLLGINCPEITGKDKADGIRCRDEVCHYLDPYFTSKQMKKKEIQEWFQSREVYCDVLFHPKQTEKFGRILATVYPLGSSVSVQEWLLLGEDLWVTEIPI